MLLWPYLRGFLVLLSKRDWTLLLLDSEQRRRLPADASGLAKTAESSSLFLFGKKIDIKAYITKIIEPHEDQDKEVMYFIQKKIPSWNKIYLGVILSSLSSDAFLCGVSEIMTGLVRRAGGGGALTGVPKLSPSPSTLSNSGFSFEGTCSLERRVWLLFTATGMANNTIKVVPGFKALGPSMALSALNPGTILLSYKEIVFKLMVDMNYSICFQKNSKEWENTQNWSQK